MSLYDIIRDERAFEIEISGKTFFFEPLFPVLEFTQYCIKWMNNPDADFIYLTIESEENPILSLFQEQNRWKIYSVWQKFECDETFTFNEVWEFVNGMINLVIL